MTENEPRFPDYGDDGDIATARRSRRSFRLVVLSVVLLTLFAWMSETRLRYSLQEQHFMTAITLPRDSARVFLLSAIRMDESTDKTPTPKYTQALAVRQEDDVALDTYATAYAMDPKNSMFTIRYGSRLYLLNRPGEAAEKFRAALALPPASSLPLYLEAAAVAKDRRDPAALDKAMVLVSRANNTRDPVIYPKPLWYSGYPQTGAQYAQSARDIYSESCAPLYALTQQVVSAVQQPAAEAGRDEPTLLRQIETMGRRLVNDSDPKGSLQAIAGISIQLQALETMRKFYEDAGSPESEDIATLDQRITTLRSALSLLNEFEAGRDALIARNIDRYWTPPTTILYTVLAMFAAYVIARLVHAVLRYRKTAWTLAHSGLGKTMLGAGAVVLFLLLGTMGLLPQPQSNGGWLAGGMFSLWWTVVAILLGFGLIYPALRLPTPEHVSGKSGRLEDMPDVVRQARSAYRRVYIAFAVRYFGVLTGLFLCVACAWVLLYRVSIGLYPWQANLLASGLGTEELEAVRNALQILGTR